MREGERRNFLGMWSLGGGRASWKEDLGGVGYVLALYGIGLGVGMLAAAAAAAVVVVDAAVVAVVVGVVWGWSWV